MLLAEVIDQEIRPESTLRSGNSTSSFRNCLLANEISVRTATSEKEDANWGLDKLLKDLDENYPTLQIAVPNMETASWESIASGEVPFYVAFLPFDYKEGDDVLVYDQNGEEHILDGKNEPETPVIVIGKSERITCVTASADKNEYEGRKVYFENENRTYYSLAIVR